MVGSTVFLVVSSADVERGRLKLSIKKLEGGSLQGREDVVARGEEDVRDAS